MVIKFSKQEIAELQNVMENAEQGSVEELQSLVKDTNLVKFRLHPIEKSLEVIINEDYMVDFLQVYGRFVPLFVSQTKALFETIKLFNEEAETIVNKYLEQEESC